MYIKSLVNKIYTNKIYFDISRIYILYFSHQLLLLDPKNLYLIVLKIRYVMIYR